MKIPPQLLINRFKNTPGAISVAECIAIYNLAIDAPKGTCIDVGSHCGKAAMAAATGFLYGKRTLHMIDPIYDLSNKEAFKHSVQQTPENIPWTYVCDKEFNFNVTENIRIVSAFDVSANLIGDYSENALTKFKNIAWCFIDSDDHCGGMAIREAKIIEDRVVPGGIVAFHDVDNQFYDPRDAMNYLVSTGKFDEIKIDWNPILKYVKENNLEHENHSWHLYPDLPHSPNFVGAVKRK